MKLLFKTSSLWLDGFCCCCKHSVLKWLIKLVKTLNVWSHSNSANLNSLNAVFLPPSEGLDPWSFSSLTRHADHWADLCFSSSKHFVFLFSVEHFDPETELLRKPGFADFVKTIGTCSGRKRRKKLLYVISLKLHFANSSFAKFCRFLKT